MMNFLILSSKAAYSKLCSDSWIKIFYIVFYIGCLLKFSSQLVSSSISTVGIWCSEEFFFLNYFLSKVGLEGGVYRKLFFSTKKLTLLFRYFVDYPGFIRIPYEVLNGLSFSAWDFFSSIIEYGEKKCFLDKL